MKGTELVNDASKRPNIAFLVVFLVMDLLWRHVVWGTNVSESKLRLLVHYSRKSEVTQLNVTIPIQEYIPRFKISMQYLLRELILLALGSSLRRWILLI
jgi:hypothetical protein